MPLPTRQPVRDMQPVFSLGSLCYLHDSVQAFPQAEGSRTWSSQAHGHPHIHAAMVAYSFVLPGALLLQEAWKQNVAAAAGGAAAQKACEGAQERLQLLGMMFRQAFDTAASAPNDCLSDVQSVISEVCCTHRQTVPAAFHIARHASMRNIGPWATVLVSKEAELNFLHFPRNDQNERRSSNISS
jgi:hypothetical protein